MARKKTEYTCTVTFTEGWQERLTQGFVELYYKRMKRGAPVTEEQEREQRGDIGGGAKNSYQRTTVGANDA